MKHFLKLIDMALTLFWILDICNMPFMQMFDTTYPLNGWFWFLAFIFIDLTTETTNK